MKYKTSIILENEQYEGYCLKLPEEIKINRFFGEFCFKLTDKSDKIYNYITNCYNDLTNNLKQSRSDLTVNSDYGNFILKDAVLIGASFGYLDNYNDYEMKLLFSYTKIEDLSTLIDLKVKLKLDTKD